MVFDVVINMPLKKIEALWASPTQTLAPMIGLHGYSLPDIGKLECSYVGDPAQNNIIVSAAGSDWASYRFHEFYGRDNVIVLGFGAKPHGWCKIFGNENVVIIGEKANPGGGHINVLVRGNNTLTFWGAFSTSQNTTLHVQGDTTKVILADHCLLSHNISIRSGDDHAILDMATGLQTNMPQDIQIEPAVWIGPDVVIAKGVHIGFGSIIAQHSVVTRKVSRHTLVGGTPARLLREGVMWDEPMISGKNRILWAREYLELL